MALLYLWCVKPYSNFLNEVCCSSFPQLCLPHRELLFLDFWWFGSARVTTLLRIRAWYVMSHHVLLGTKILKEINYMRSDQFRYALVLLCWCWLPHCFGLKYVCATLKIFTNDGRPFGTSAQGIYGRSSLLSLLCKCCLSVLWWHIFDQESCVGLLVWQCHVV